MRHSDAALYCCKSEQQSNDVSSSPTQCTSTIFSYLSSLLFIKTKLKKKTETKDLKNCRSHRSQRVNPQVEKRQETEIKIRNAVTSICTNVISAPGLCNGIAWTNVTLLHDGVDCATTSVQEYSARRLARTHARHSK